MKIRRLFFAFSVAVFVVLAEASCSVSNDGYQIISQEKAKEMMESEQNLLIVDVRTKEEYEAAHIPNAVLVPIEDIRAGKVEALSDKNQVLLLYCRTGRRAEDSAAELVKLGYKKVYSFGGILEWTGKKVSGEKSETSYKRGTFFERRTLLC